MDTSRPGISLIPEAMLDVGDTERSHLGDLAARRLQELPIGGILEIVSLGPAHRRGFLDWCHEMTFDCLQMAIDGDRTWFWIKKRSGANHSVSSHTSVTGNSELRT